MARSLKKIALIVALATALSKVAGLVRQQVIAAAFGVGAAYDAYNYAYVLPGFLLILLGGINAAYRGIGGILALPFFICYTIICTVRSRTKYYS
jgi:hypothetical protein